MHSVVAWFSNKILRVDAMEPLSETSSWNCYIFVMISRFTKSCKVSIIDECTVMKAISVDHLLWDVVPDPLGPRGRFRKLIHAPRRTIPLWIQGNEAVRKTNCVLKNLGKTWASTSTDFQIHVELLLDIWWLTEAYFICLSHLFSHPCLHVATVPLMKPTTLSILAPNYQNSSSKRFCGRMQCAKVSSSWIRISPNLHAFDQCF